MLRLLVLLLLLANLAFFAWSGGWLADLGLPATGDREPQRLTRQVNPDAVKLLPPQAASAALAAASAARAPQCLEAGPFAAAEVDVAERELAGLPAGSWARTPADGTGRVMLRVARADAALRAQLLATSLQFAPCGA